MHRNSTDDGQAVVSLSRHELAVLANALNETLEAVDAADLSARVGADADELGALHSALRAAAGAVA